MSREIQTSMDLSGEQVIIKSLDTVIHESMMPYSEHVIMDRALPRVEDGLKPVQRRILYSMIELGLTPDKPHKKSARIVGDCMGKYHPHGDSSVYNAMVRMAQPFNMSMPLVDGHGNFGTPDGDPAAAMRYTEARLAPLALELLRDMKKGTVTFSPNFDDSMLEPDVLPGRFPNLLVNGASGIAVGLATEIPPHNITEVIDGTIMLINSPRTPLAELMKVIKGPDFPTGGYCSAGDELENAYATGKGKLVVRAKVHIEGGDNERKSIVITEFPYQVNPASLQLKIMELKESKKEIFAGISDIMDLSNKDETRVVVKLKKGTDPDKILSALYKYTQLQNTFAVNMVAIADGKPKQMGIIEILKYYIEYQRTIIVKRTQFDLKEAKDRVHILEGLLVAIQNIDEVIRIIKGASSTADARQKLRIKFELSEKQAVAILDMRLARLTKLETTKLEEEIRELNALIERLNAILASKSQQMSVLKAELNDIKKRFKCPRRTQMVENYQLMDSISSSTDNADATTIEVKDGYLCLSEDSRLKFVTTRSYNLADTKASTTEPAVVQLLKADTSMMLFAFGSEGNCYKIPVCKIPLKKYRDKGIRVQEICANSPSSETIVSALITKDKAPDQELYIYTEKGMVKRIKWTDCDVQKACYSVMSLKDGDKVIGVEVVKEGSTIFYGTEQGMCLNSLVDDIALQGRTAGGVKGISLNDGDRVLTAFQNDGEGEVVVVTTAGLAKRVVSATLDESVRYRKGVKIIDLPKSKVVVKFYSYVKLPYDLVLTRDGAETLVVNTEDIGIDARTTKGKSLYKGSATIKAVTLHLDQNSSVISSFLDEEF